MVNANVIQIKNGIMINASASVKSIVCATNIVVGNLAHVFVRIVGIQKSIVDDSVILCHEIINVTDNVSKNVTNTISTNVMSSVSINSDDEKVRYKMNFYILHMFLLVTILLFTNITI